MQAENFPGILEEESSGIEHHIIEKTSSKPLLKEVVIAYGLGTFVTMCPTNFLILPFVSKMAIGKKESINGFFLKFGAFVSGFVFSLFFFSDFFTLLLTVLCIYGAPALDKEKSRD
ncbi:MAG: hypothetical protein ACPGR8_15255 [Limisphaerales bacterium]